MFRLRQMSLGSRIRYYRNKAGWTLEQLSERCGVDVGTINALENRNSRRSQYAVQIASGFGLTLNQLEDEIGDYLVPAERQVANGVAQERGLYSVTNVTSTPFSEDEKSLLEGFRCASDETKRHLLMIAKDALTRFEQRSEKK